MTRLTSWQDLRALRAAPPGLAAQDADRRSTFVAALRQAEELAEAAASASYATKALPLFYALSQAGRAIAAAHLPDPWQLRGHGLGVRSNTGRIVESTVKPSSGPQDSFNGTAAAIHSAGLAGSAELGELWAANPDLSGVEIPGASATWLRPIEFVLGTLQPPPGSAPGYEATEVHTSGHVTMPVDVPGTTAREVVDALAGYPSLRGAFAVKQGPQGVEEAGPDEVVYRDENRPDRPAVIARSCPLVTTMNVYWDKLREFASVVDHGPQHGYGAVPEFVGYAVPEVAGGPAPHPLMLWWALLLGLSSLTRYEPAAWSAAIDLDASELAVPLEQVLDIAEARLPARILESLRGPH